MKTLVAVISLLLQFVVAAKDRPVSVAPIRELTPAQAARVDDYTPAPEYPFEARRRHIAGSGYFRLHVQARTGLVKLVEVEQSTGSQILDVAAINTYKLWRFKPLALRSILGVSARTDKSEELIIRLPVTFRLRKSVF
jgi:TonB family protein